MPPYFYHLAFHLYPQPTGPSDASPTRPTTISDCLEALRLEKASFTPASLTPLSEGRAQRQRFHRPGLRPEGEHPVNQTEAASQQQIASAENDKPRPCDQRTNTQDITQDWRFAKVEIDSIDMELTQEAPPPTSDPAPLGTTMRGRYIASSPKTSEVGWGVVHLFRDAQPIGHENTTRTQGDVEEDCTTLCILAVPSYMTPSDLLGWLGESTRDGVSHLRLIRTARANRYMVLMKFRDAQVCRGWQREWNGKLFNSMEPENCHVVFLKSILSDDTDSKRDPSAFPDMSRDPFTPAEHAQSTLTAGQSTTSADTLGRTSASLTSKPAPPPTPALVELPTCPVCLERMDETTGLATIFCQHVFHCACLQKWRGSGCPVCRYTQNDHSHGVKGKMEAEDEECRACGATSNLWICLICGNVGCGRYDEAHAFAHYEQTAHAFAMDIATQHVWDYASDGYVHRLIQNKADGKLVELPSARHTDAATTKAAQHPEKLEDMAVEYTALLTSQLDSQRAYFEEQLDRAVDKAAQAALATDSTLHRLALASTSLAALQAAHDALTHDTLPALERAERRADRFEASARRAERERRDAAALNDALADKVAWLEKRVGEVEGEKGELEEVNRDLTAHISAGLRLGEEAVGGGVGVVEAPAAAAAAGKRKKRRGKG